MAYRRHNGWQQRSISQVIQPESLARVDSLSFLTEDQKRLLNQIRGNAYLSIFGLVEEFILPFVLDHARPQLQHDDYRTRALLQFAGEEAKHIQLFKRFREEFESGFGTSCPVIGPPEAIASAIPAHDPLAVTLTILHIEWMVQRHYTESIRDNKNLDPQFKSLLKHHWLEEIHSKLDTLMVEAWQPRSEQQSLLPRGSLKRGLSMADVSRVEFDLDSFRRRLPGTGRTEKTVSYGFYKQIVDVSRTGRRIRSSGDLGKFAHPGPVSIASIAPAFARL